MDSKTENVLDLLLRPEMQDVRKHLPEKRVRVKRLSELAGQDVIFTLRGLPYDKIRRAQKMEDDRALSMVLDGCAEPDFRDKRLLDEETGIITPFDAIKSRLTTGEIDEIAVEVQILSGYLSRALDEVKNA